VVVVTATAAHVPVQLPDAKPVAGRPAGGTGTLLLLVSIVITFLAASSAPTPLYQHYDQVWHGSALTTTAAFGVYALAVLIGLLTLGELSNHVGRKPVLLAALAGQSAAVLLFATAGSFTPLFAGRAIQGLAAGAALGTLGAGMIDVDRVRGTLSNAAAPGAGTGIGALAAGLVVGYLPWPTHLIFLLLLAAFAVQAVGVGLLARSTPRVPGALASLRPQIVVPAAARTAFLTAAPVLFAVWALAGFYGSLGPALSRQLAGSDSVALGGVALFVLAGVASLTTLVLRGSDGRVLMLVGVGALVAGVTGTVVAIEVGSITGYLVATAVAGVGFGSGFQGGIRTVVPLAEPRQRPGLLSAVFLVSYVGMGAPAVVAGLLVSRGGSLTGVASGYAVVLVVLALSVLAGLLRRRSIEPVPAARQA
jgi:MFS family permease